MKKWLYLIFPSAMLAIFLVFYFSHLRETEAKDIARKAAATEELKVINAKKAENDKKAKEDAAKRAAEKAAEDRAKEAEKLARWNAEGTRIQSEINDSNAKIERYTKEAATLEAKLDDLHKKKDRLSRETFDYAKQVERARVDRRSAELESQRLLDMVTRRADESSMAKPPAPPAAPAGT